MNFDNKAKDWDKDPKKIERASIFAGEILRELGEKVDLAALEFGSGTGLVSFELAGRFRSIVLADTSAGMLEVLGQKIKTENISNMEPFHVNESNSLSNLSGFDVIYTLLTMHHVHDINSAFSEFRSLLKPGGMLFIGDLITEDGSFHSMDPDFDGHKGFETSDLIGLLQINGFENCSSRIFYNLEKGTASGKKSYPLFFLSATRT